VLAAVLGKLGLVWALAAVLGKLRLVWALAAVLGKLGLVWALVVAPETREPVWVWVVVPVKRELVWVLVVVLATLAPAWVSEPVKREPAWVWDLVTRGPVLELDRPCGKLSLSQMGFRLPEQRYHLCTRVPGFAEDLTSPSGSRFGIEIATEQHHQIYEFANILLACDSIRRCALDSVLDRFPELCLALGLALSREEFIQMHKHPAFELLHFYAREFGELGRSDCQGSVSLRYLRVEALAAAR